MTLAISKFTRVRAMACAAALSAVALAHAEVKLKSFATGLVSPVDIVNADDARLFIVEQRGTVKVIQNGVVAATPFLDLTANVLSGGERGLLGLAFAPDYATSGRFYVYYTRKPDGALVISRFKPASGSGTPIEEPLLTIPHSDNTNHNGGSLRFGADGMLYIGTGDGGGGGDPQCNAQNRASLLGKLLRIDVSGATGYAVPDNNPLDSNSQPSPILAIGLRNPWRISFDRSNGDLFIGDVGQGAREEINRLPAYNPATSPTAPLNYGWPRREGLISYGTNCANATGVTSWIDPILDYPRSEGQSVTGGYRYRGTRVPELATSPAYVYGDFANGRIWSATPPATGSWPSTLITDATFNVSTFGEDASGELYVADYFGGTIYKFTSTLGPSLDVDLNGGFDAATDGVLLMRYLLGFRDEALIGGGAVGAGAQRDSAQAIQTHIANTLATFNVDGRAGTSATTDGILAIRFLLGLSDTALTNGTAATQSAAQIRAALESLKP